MTRYVFPNGLDDFQSGVLALIELTLANSSEDQRELIAAALIEEAHDYSSPGLNALFVELSAYVAWCANAEAVSQALARFLLEGGHIQKHNQKKKSSKGTQKAAAAREKTSNEKHKVWNERADKIRLKNPNHSNTQIGKTISSAMEHTEYAGAPDTIRGAIGSKKKTNYKI